MNINGRNFATKEEKSERLNAIFNGNFTCENNPRLISWPKGCAIYTVYYSLYGAYPRLSDMPEIANLNKIFNRLK